MEKIKLQTEFDFDSAHRLVGYKGNCHKIHGHMWKVKVEVEGDKLDDVGMLIDFKEIKAIKNQFDHKTILKDCKENEDIIKVIKKVCGKDSVTLMHNNPTAEYLALFIADTLKIRHPEFKFKITIWESTKSSAEVER